MKHYKNFRVGEPKVRPDDAPVNTIFIIDEDGNSWYDVMGSFSTGTYKIQYDGRGLIRCIFNGNPDGQMFPTDCSVLELKEVPDDLSREHYIVEDGKLVHKENAYLMAL